MTDDFKRRGAKCRSLRDTNDIESPTGCGMRQMIAPLPCLNGLEWAVRNWSGHSWAQPYGARVTPTATSLRRRKASVQGGS